MHSKKFHTIFLGLTLSTVSVDIFAAGSSGQQQAPIGTAAGQQPVSKISSIDEIQALVDAARYDEAIGKARELVKSEKSAPAYTLLGFALRKEKKWSESIAAYNEALHIDPSFAQAKEYLGVAYLNQGQEKLAKDLYADLIKSNPTLAEILKSEATKQGHKW
ncbi:MAG: tetratricopeptide repeat protein [Oligoflexus sp.]|nr:tetratricopeptide repeat protein [Oligoflexus sp.]